MRGIAYGILNYEKPNDAILVTVLFVNHFELVIVQETGSGRVNSGPLRQLDLREAVGVFVYDISYILNNDGIIASPAASDTVSAPAVAASEALPPGYHRMRQQQQRPTLTTGPARTRFARCG